MADPEMTAALPRHKPASVTVTLKDGRKATHRCDDDRRAGAALDESEIREKFRGLAGLVLVGLRDVTQARHAILRNYPVIGHLRFLLEFIRPEIRQYFIEDDRDAAPFSRQQRSLVYQRAKGDSDKRPFGTQINVAGIGYEWINHSLQPSVLTVGSLSPPAPSDRDEVVCRACPPARRPLRSARPGPRRLHEQRQSQPGASGVG